ncbi:class I SAM-dependent methyltransferase [Paenibacillus larvae]|nr:class I SAM-dependent methyltransferase [Paenibacillus larvae]MDT2241844.1 class I SAM-dependent methyltransferase [Paenibacillus larvae]
MITAEQQLRKAFSLEEMQEYIGNFQTKLKPHLAEGITLEVGCGHGLLLFHLALDVKEYVVTGSIRYDHRTEPGEGKAGRVIPCKAQQAAARRSGV